MKTTPSTPRKTPQANPTDETHLQQNSEDDHLILRGRGDGLCRVRILFPIFCGRQYLFASNYRTAHLF